MECNHNKKLLKIFKDKISNLLKLHYIYDILFDCNKILVISDNRSFYDIIEILNKEKERKCLIWSSKKERIINILNCNNILNLFLALNNFKVNGITDIIKKSKIIKLKKILKIYNGSIEIEKSLINDISKFKLFSTECSLYEAFKFFAENEYSDVLIYDKKESNYIAFLNIKHIFIFIIKNIKWDLNLDKILNYNVDTLNLQSLETKFKMISVKKTILQVLTFIKNNNLNYVLLINNDNKFIGYIDKSFILSLYSNNLLRYLNSSIEDFIILLENEKINLTFFELNKNLFYDNSFLFKDILQKILLSNNYMFNTKNSVIVGVISFKDLLNYLH